MIGETEFVERIREMTDGLYRLSVSILRSGADAQDAVQQALCNAWAARDRVTEDYFRPWLTRIVINECRNLQRKKARVQPSDQMEQYAGEQAPPDLTLRDAIDHLPEKLRLPLILKYLEGYSEQELSKALRLPVTTVKGRLHRARLALKGALSDNNPKEEATCGMI